jgi:putative peptidoglycan lipid II flippase
LRQWSARLQAAVLEPSARAIGYVARALGVARDIAIAAIFRADETDSFFLAFTLPSALRQLLADGAVSHGVVPVLAKRLQRDGEAAARDLYLRLRGAFGAVLLLVTAAGMLLARPIAELLAPGYADRHGQLERTVALTRSLFPFLFLSGIAALGMAALHLKKRHDAIKAAPTITSLSFLLAAFALPDLLDLRGWDRAQALAVGALLGGAVQVAVQLPALRKLGWGGQAIIDLRDPRVRDVARRVAPLALALSAHYVELFLSRRFLSELGLGAQSWFSWAMRICETPQTLFAAALAVASARSFGARDPRAEAGEIARAYVERLCLVLFIAIPSTVLLAVLARPIVVALFQRGEFGAHDAIETARALVWQAAAITWLASARQLGSASYALRDTRSPLVAGAVGTLTFVATALALRGRMGHSSISAALLASSVVQTFALVAALRGRLALRPGKVFASVARTTAASVGAAAVAGSAAWLLLDGAGPGAIARILPGAIGGALFVATFLVAARGLRSPELAAIAGRGTKHQRAAR